jgi:hypothetical protein
MYEALLYSPDIVGPAGQNGSIVLCVDNHAGEKSSRSSTRYPISSFWGPSFIVWPNYCRTVANIEDIFIIIIYLNNISLPYNEKLNN